MNLQIQLMVYFEEKKVNIIKKENNINLILIHSEKNINDSIFQIEKNKKKKKMILFLN